MKKFEIRTKNAQAPAWVVIEADYLQVEGDFVMVKTRDGSPVAIVPKESLEYAIEQKQK